MIIQNIFREIRSETLLHYFFFTYLLYVKWCDSWLIRINLHLAKQLIVDEILYRTTFARIS